MARARNIKPGFFKNEILGVADPLYSLLFEGLWVLADREGRIEDRPLRIQGEVFPYRPGLDMEGMLNWLQDNGFIRRYAAKGKKCILVLEFVKHQNPHKNESASDLPAPEEIGTTPEFIGSTRADSLSSDSLNSDSLHSVPDGTGADAPVEGAIETRRGASAKDQVFAIGVTLLTAADVSDKNARSFLAAQCKAHGDQRVLDALQACATEQAVQPVPWVVAYLGAGTTKARSPPEPEWRKEQRERTQIAAPGVASGRQQAAEFFDVEARVVRAIRGPK